MAATDVKDIFEKVLASGERWLYKRLCDGTELPIIRICNCSGDPDDPGDSPPVIVDAEICRVANGIGAYIQGRSNYFATLLGEQPDNEFGSFAVALAWLTNTFGVLYPANLWSPTKQLAIDYNNTDEGLLGDGVPVAGQMYACAAYSAIVADENGVNLSPEFAERFAQHLIEFAGTSPSPEIVYTLPFVSRVIQLIPLSKYKRIAFEASTLDPLEMGDYDCETCLPAPVGDPCTGISWAWNLVGTTPAGFSVPTGLMPDLIPTWRDWNVNELNADPAVVDSQENSVSRAVLSPWTCPLDNSAPIDYFMMVVYEFPETCVLTEAHMRVATGTQNSKRAGILYQLEGQDEPEDWTLYAANYVNLQGGYLTTSGSLVVEGVARMAFCGCYGGGQLFMIDTAINKPIA